MRIFMAGFFGGRWVRWGKEAYDEDSVIHNFHGSHIVDFQECGVRHRHERGGIQIAAKIGQQALGPAY